MSYPKKIQRGMNTDMAQSLNNDPKRERLIAIQERERLKGQLVSKYAEKYAKDNKINRVIVNKQVAEFVKNNEKPSEESLKRLEQQINYNINNKTGLTQQPSSASMQLEGTNNYANTYASAPDANDDAVSVSSSERPKSIYMQGANDDEWAAIAKYDTKKYKNELAAAKQRERDQKKNIKDELDRQIAHKKQMLKNEAEELRRYVGQVQEQVKQGDEKERKKVQDMQNKILQQKASRDQQLLDEINKKKNERKAERQKEELLVQKLRQDMDNDTKMAASKRAADRDYMKKVYSENELYKVKMFEEANVQRELDVKAQQEYTRLIEKQMADREAEVREREERAKKFMSMMANTVVKDQRAQQLEEERKILRNYDEKERADAEEDRRKKEVLNEKKREMTEYLHKQLEEKERKKREEKEAEKRQAEIWRKDTEEFRASEKAKEMRARDVNTKNSEYIKTQIMGSAEKQKKMNDEEALYNKSLLKQIASDEEGKRFKKQLVNHRH